MIRIGQIGVGYWGKNLLRNFWGVADCNVVCCCDLNLSVLESVKENYPGVRTTQDPQSVIGDESVDAVVIATPSPTHYELARGALYAGKDVFVEKPFVLDVREGEELVGIAKQKGKVLMVGHLMEYHPSLLRLKEYVQNNELGDVHYIYSARVNLGRVRREENALWSFAPHDISMVTFLLEDEPILVSAVGQEYLQDGVEDVVFMTMHFKDRVMAHIHVSWLDPHRIRKLTIVGSKKMAVFDDTNASETIRIYDRGVDQNLEYESYGEALSIRVGDIVIPSVKVSEPLGEECRHFIDCVKERRTPRSDGIDGLRVVRILNAAQRSMSGKGVPVPL